VLSTHLEKYSSNTGFIFPSNKTIFEVEEKSTNNHNRHQQKLNFTGVIHYITNPNNALSNYRKIPKQYTPEN